MPGTRSGGAIAAAWGALMAMGEDGYLDHARRALDTARRLQSGLGAIAPLEVVGRPDATLVAWRSTDPSVATYAIADQLEDEGWTVDRQQYPTSIHCTVTSHHGAPEPGQRRALRDDGEAPGAHDGEARGRPGHGVDVRRRRRAARPQQARARATVRSSRPSTSTAPPRSRRSTALSPYASGSASRSAGGAEPRCGGPRAGSASPSRVAHETPPAPPKTTSATPPFRRPRPPPRRGRRLAHRGSPAVRPHLSTRPALASAWVPALRARPRARRRCRAGARTHRSDRPGAGAAGAPTRRSRVRRGARAPARRR